MVTLLAWLICFFEVAGADWVVGLGHSTGSSVSDRIVLRKVVRVSNSLSAAGLGVVAPCVDSATFTDTATAVFMDF